MNEQLQVVVIAHQQGVAAFRRHLKYWEAYRAPVMVVTPENDAVETRHETIKIGSKERAGAESIRRLYALLDNLAARNWSRCAVFEYDSFALDISLPSGPGFFGNVFRNDESPKFMAPRYPNPPWCFDRATFEVLHATARRWWNLAEEGEADRWFGALAFLGGVPLRDFEPRGFSRGEVKDRDLPALRTAIYEGAIWIHGVKQSHVLAAVEQFYDESHPAEFSGKLKAPG